MTANKDDVREALESIVRYRIKSRRKKVRDERWKPYLFIYDLRRKYHEMTYKEFTDNVCDLCLEFKIIYEKNGKLAHQTVDSREYFDEKRCENYYKSARFLIEGGYKKYLYLLE